MYTLYIYMVCFKAKEHSDKTDIERVRKYALYIIIGDQYLSYADALDKANLDSLDTREGLCLKFAKKAVKDVKHKNWFKPKPQLPTRLIQDKYFKPMAQANEQPYMLPYQTTQ